MSMQITLAGTVRADGSLELDEKVAMPEGRVLVTVQPAVQPAPDDPFWKAMEAIWAGQRARGHVPRTKEQVDTDLREFRNDAEDEIQALERLHQECRHGQDKHLSREEKAP